MNQRVDGLWKAVEDAKQKIALLNERIRLGQDSLGNSFENFAFCTLGANQDNWKVLYDLQEKFEDSKGSELLLVSSSKTPFEPMTRYASPSFENNTSHPPRQFYDTSYRFLYSVLQQGGIDYVLGKDVRHDKIIFPSIDHHLQVSANSVMDGNLSGTSVFKSPGRIACRLGDLPHLIEKANLGWPSCQSMGIGSDILVGPEVKEYFEKIDENLVYSRMKEML